MTAARLAALQRQAKDLEIMLRSKDSEYGERDGFGEANSKGNYSHALGEARLTLMQFANTGNIHYLVKASAWLFLIYETELDDKQLSLIP